MSTGMVMDLVRNAITVIVMVSGPLMIVSVIVGLAISILQTTTSIQEQTLTFVPKILAILGALVFLGYYMMNHLVDYTLNLFAIIPDLVK